MEYNPQGSMQNAEKSIILHHVLNYRKSKLSSDAFTSAEYKVINNAANNIKNKRENPTIEAIADELYAMNKIEMVGGYERLSALLSFCPLPPTKEQFNLVEANTFKTKLIKIFDAFCPFDEDYQDISEAYSLLITEISEGFLESKIN